MIPYSKNIRSWGYVPEGKQKAINPLWVPASLGESTSTSILAFGNGRSYGDSCLNSDGVLIETGALDRYVSFDRVRGVLTAEPGVLLSDILDLIVPQGWMFPVCPGTSFVTLAGAVANDVHGKNHHRDGTLGRHIIGIKILRSDGNLVRCSPRKNSGLFAATIGGLGLTGFITEVSVQLMPINSCQMDVRFDLFNGLHEFAILSERRKKHFRYTVAWLDCANSGVKFSRGIFISANFSKSDSTCSANRSKAAFNWRIPINFPNKSLNKYTIRAFNDLYFQAHRKLHQRTTKQSLRNFFFPLDGVRDWNKIYGKYGFHQYQFVVPLQKLDALEEILSIIVSSGMGSFLAVLKEFGSLDSPGLLSFPREGWCLALDFSNRRDKTVQLIEKINKIVIASGGAVYPAKDRLMSRDTFIRSFPNLSDFENHKDDHFSSDFWVRVNAE